MSKQPVDVPFVPIVNREKEIGEATFRLEQMLSDLPVIDCVLFFYGVPMVGKTTLLEAIRREASRRGIASALVDFDREQSLKGRRVDDWYDGLAGQVHVAQRLMNELSETGELIPGSPIASDDIEAEEARERLLSFARDLYRFGQRHPFLLLFDTAEDCDPETFLWTQSAILEPFINEFHTLVVFASLTPPNATRHDLIYPLERRTKKYPLHPFDEYETDLQVEKTGGRDVLPLPGTELRRYTGGLPGLNDAAIRWFAKQQPADQLLIYLVEKIIFDRLAHRIDELNIKAEVLAISPLRQFDSGLLGQVVRTLWPEKYPEAGLKPVRQLIYNLQETRLVEPHPDGYGYVIPHDLRQVLDVYWRQTQPEKHFQVHQIAARWFAKQIIEGDFVAIADRLYHLGGLQRDLNEHPHLREYLEPGVQSDPARIGQLERELDEAFRMLREASSRSFDLSNKIKRVLEQPEFSLIFEADVLNTLIKKGEAFNDKL